MVVTYRYTTTLLAELEQARQGSLEARREASEAREVARHGQSAHHGSAHGSAPALPPVPPQRAPGAPVQLGTPRVRPSHGAPRYRLGCSSDPRPKPPVSLRLTTQAAHRSEQGMYT